MDGGSTWAPRFLRICPREWSVRSAFAHPTTIQSHPRSVRRRPSSQHDDRRADVHPLIEVHDVVIVHANAAEGHVSANGVRAIGAMNGVFAAAQRQGRSAHGILRATARNEIGRAGLFHFDFGGRRPCGSQELAVDVATAGPCFSGFADPDGIADSLAIAEYEIEFALAGL